MPKLSIIIPVYNVEDYIRQCLLSICQQVNNESDVEVIIINDGTKDSSMCTAKEIREKYSFVQIIDQSNSGLSSTRNKGISIAKGNYVWFVDSDDWLIEYAISSILNLIQKNPADIYVTPLLYYKDNKLIKKDIEIDDDVLTTGKNYIVERKFPLGASQRLIIKLDLLKSNEIRFIEGVLHEDGPFGYMTMYFAKRVLVLQKALYCYRQRNNSIMHSMSINNSYDLIKGHMALRFFCEQKVDVKDRPKFMLSAVILLISSYTFVPNLFCTRQFRAFEKINKSYIRKEIMAVLRCASIKKRILYILFILMPKSTAKYLIHKWGM